MSTFLCKYKIKYLIYLLYSKDSNQFAINSSITSNQMAHISSAFKAASKVSYLL